MTHQEIQIAPGVYVTDFRPNGSLKGLNEYQWSYLDRSNS
jgi:hypothetical protein